MKKITILLASLLMLLSCGNSYPEPDNKPIEPDKPSKSNPVSSFTYTITTPFCVHFSNQSKNASSYIWNFGDGTTSRETNPKHRYKTKGVYKVTLNAYGNNTVDQYENIITVTEPTEVYFAGVIYKKLPIENEYIRAELTDDDIFTTTWCNTEYKLISKANMPYRYELRTPVLLNDMLSDDWYKLSIYWNKTNDNYIGNLVGSGKFYTKDILSTYPTEKNFKGENIEFTILFKYK